MKPTMLHSSSEDRQSQIIRLFVCCRRAKPCSRFNAQWWNYHHWQTHRTGKMDQCLAESASERQCDRNRIRQKRCRPPSPRKNNSVTITFGQMLGYQAEVAPVNLRDINIIQDGKLTREWKLWKHNDNLCYDEKREPSRVLSSLSGW